MCLAVPGKLLETQVISDSRLGVVDFGGTKRSVLLDFVPEAEVGDYVLVHVGFAISRIDEQEAQRTYELLERIGMLETGDAPIEAEESAAATGLGGPDALHR
ncbi:MAG TPA: HypC/HybG/HupF family hydrogenase formation chaperone [Bryobacteraceae bacterium]|nr:HypC/HybG/HupF family hydrogenase formation chaperone [Bryobacteraceae bacterium]